MSINVIDDGGLGLIEALTKQFNDLQADFAALVTAFNTHVHGGITAGSADTSVPTVLEGAPSSTQLNLFR